MIRVGKPEIEAVSRVIESGALFRYSHGSAAPTETELFESEFAAWCGTSYAVGVGSGTDALHLASSGSTGRFATFDEALLRRAKALPQAPAVVEP